MNIHKIPVGMLSSNSYAVWDEDKNAVLIDCGAEYKRILNFLEENGLSLKKILLTHGHFDHADDASKLKEKTGAEIMIHQNDEELLLNPKLIGGMFAPFLKSGAQTADSFFEDGDVIETGGLSFKVLLTPGHTNGSCCFIAEDSIFTGDTLFAGGCGRCDMYGGDSNEMMKSLKKLSSLEGDYKIFPGHGEETALSCERKTNPYMREKYDDIF